MKSRILLFLTLLASLGSFGQTVNQAKLQNAKPVGGTIMRSIAGGDTSLFINQGAPGIVEIPKLDAVSKLNKENIPADADANQYFDDGQAGAFIAKAYRTGDIISGLIDPNTGERTTYRVGVTTKPDGSPITDADLVQGAGGYRKKDGQYYERLFPDKKINADVFGIKGDGSDETDKVQKWLNFAREGYTLDLGGKHVSVSSLRLPRVNNLTLTGSGGKIDNRYGANGSTILSEPLGGYYQSLGKIVTTNIPENSKVVNISSSANLSKGDYIWLYTTQPIGTIDTSYLRGEIFYVADLSNNTLTLDRGVSLSMDASKIEVRKYTSLNNLNINDITFIPYHANDFAIAFNFISNSTFTNVQVRPNTVALVAFSVAGYNVTFENCRAFRCPDPSLVLGYGFSVSGFKITISNSFAEGCKHNFTSASRNKLSKNIRFINCTSQGSPAYGIDFHAAVINSSIENCRSYSDARGIEIRAFKDITVRDCQVYDVTGNAVILFSEATGTLENFTLTGCTFNNGPDRGIIGITTFPTTLVGGRFINNTFKGFKTPFKLVTANGLTLNNCTVSGNVVLDSREGGIAIEGSRNIVSGNHIKDIAKEAAGFGIENVGESNEIKNNTVKYTGTSFSQSGIVDRGVNTVISGNDVSTFPSGDIRIATGAEANKRFVFSNKRYGLTIDVLSTDDPNISRRVMETAQGSDTIAEQWYKVAAVNFGLRDYTDFTLTLSFSAYTGFTQNAQVVFTGRQATSSSSSIFISSTVISMSKGATVFSPDGFLITHDGYGKPFNIYVKKNTIFTKVIVQELSRAITPGDFLTYFPNQEWINSAPSGTFATVLSSYVQPIATTHAIPSPGTTTVSIPHSLGTVPSSYSVYPESANASGISWYEATSTAIVLHYSTAPTGMLNYRISLTK